MDVIPVQLVGEGRRRTERELHSAFRRPDRTGYSQQFPTNLECRLTEVPSRTTVQMALATILEQEGITPISASTGQDVTADVRDDPMREAMALIQGIFAQTDKKLLVRKLRRAREAKRSTGARVEGRKPYPPDVVDLVRKLRRRRKRGVAWSYQMVADELTRVGVSTKNGKPWNQGTVAHLLKGKTRMARDV